MCQEMVSRKKYALSLRSVGAYLKYPQQRMDDSESTDLWRNTYVLLLFSLYTKSVVRVIARTF